MSKTGSDRLSGHTKPLMTATQWQQVLQQRPAAIRKALADVYGNRPDIVQLRETKLADMLALFERTFGGQQPLVIARAPGRANLLGRHIDHRGGYVNSIAIQNDVWMAAAARGDEHLRLRNLDEGFEPYDLDPEDLWQAAAGTTWRDFVNGQAVGGYLASRRGVWANYVVGAYLRLRHEFGDRARRGMDAVVWGDVPQSVGLSSSSSLFVAATMVLAELGNIEIPPNQMVGLCGEGEWFVGTRGGAGDHAAMVYGRRSRIARIGFFPNHLAGSEPLPRDLEIVLCNSGQRAEKSRNARDRFNARVAAYEIGLELLRQRCPALMAEVEHLRDISPGTLGVDVGQVYQALKRLPEWMSRAQVREVFQQQPDRLAGLFASHNDVERGYPLRAVMLFGIAECERSRLALDVFCGGDSGRIGRLFAVSHDGDRVSRRDHNGRRQPWRAPVDDRYLDEMIALARGGDPGRRERADLVHQSGAYGCSTEEIDEMVDIARDTEGVLGAQLVGAGLGGSIVALVRAGAAEALTRALERGYYGPRGIESHVRVFQPSEGASCFWPAT